MSKYPPRWILLSMPLALVCGLSGFALHAQSDGEEVLSEETPSEPDDDAEDRLGVIPDRLPPRALEQVAAYTAEAGDGRGFITARNLAWNQPYVKVAFEAAEGADRSAYFSLIEAAAKEWIAPGTRFAMSFRNNDGTYRTWSRRDRMPAGTIRVAFDNSGSWSLLGRQAQGRDVKPGEPTMNLELGPLGTAGLSNSDRLTVLHEFGHALGLAHEHYHAQCQADLKFEPDPGYVETVAPGTESAPEYRPDSQGRSPGVLRSLSGAPNFWERRDTQFNYDWAAYSRETGLKMKNVLRGSGDGSDAGFVQSDTIDRGSVMLYKLPAFLLRSGRQSPCRFTAPGVGVNLSPMDRQAFASLYPRR